MAGEFKAIVVQFKIEGGSPKNRSALWQENDFIHKDTREILKNILFFKRQCF